MKRTVLTLVSLAALAAPVFAADAGSQSAFGGFVPLIVIFVIFYFLLIRPQQKRAKEHTALLNGLKKDDKIITNGGLYGVITGVKGDVLEVKIAENVKVEISRDITAYGDRVLLGQVLENLLGNAWKFTAKAPEPRIEMGLIEKDGKQTYYVRDNGAGFNMEYAERLFKPFQRLHAASDFPGTGIGLAIVLQIVRRHGGDVRAEGKVGEGAVFYFTLS